MTTPKEQMSDERLAAIKRAYSVDVDTPMARQVIELLAEIDALRAELTAARTVEDGEVAKVVERQSQLADYFDGRQSTMVIRANEAINLLTRLSAAKAEAELLLQVERGAMDLQANLLKGAVAKTMAAERERDEARAQALRSASEAEDWKWAAGDREKERDEARDALAQAREAALEEAAKVVEGQSVATNYLPDRYDVNSLASWLSDRDFRTATAIRALKTTPTQESETP